VATEEAPRVRYGSTLDFLRALPGPARRFWLLVVATGLLAGLGAAGLLLALRAVQAAAWGASGHAGFLEAVDRSGGLRRVLVPTAAGVLVMLASAAARRPLKGYGTAGIIESIWARSGRMPLPWALFRGAVSIAAVGLGAPLGREGALLSSGAATASALSTRFQLGPEQRRLLVACGASAGMAAAYNAPIGAALFGLEVLLGSFALELFGPIVIASVIATAVARLLIGDHPAYLIPHYAGGAWTVAVAALLGPLLGVASAIYVRTVSAFSQALERPGRLRALVSPVVAMAAVGASALWFPQLLGNGYESVNAALVGQLPMALLLVLPWLKMVATAGAAGAGVPGGLFTPSLFFGSMLGGAVGHLVVQVAPGAPPEGAFALLGMGAVLAGTTHAAVSSVLLIFELTGDYGVVLPLMVVSVLAAAVSRRLAPQSLYTEVLHRRRVALPQLQPPSWLTRANAGQLMEPGAVTLREDASLDEVMATWLELEPGHDIHVTAPDGRYLGPILVERLRGHAPDHQRLRRTTARELVDHSIPRVREDMAISELAALFGRVGVERLPVVDAGGRLVGTVGKSIVLSKGLF
jgi:CIC family chloride channel protein